MAGFIAAINVFFLAAMFLKKRRLRVPKPFLCVMAG